MSQEPEDVKPKLNLNIRYDENVVTVKVKPNMKFAKIFAAAEVSNAHLVRSGQLKTWFFPGRRGLGETPVKPHVDEQIDLRADPSTIGTLRFTFEGNRLRPEETPADVGIEDGDQIDAHLPQVGGKR